MNPIPLVAFTGLAHAGKTTCAEHLQRTRGFTNFSFADPFKKMLSALVDITDKDATPDVLCGKTVRYAMQSLGTEWGRHLIGQDIWLRASKIQIEVLRAFGVIGITCDDVRFDNEAMLIRELGGVVIEIIRPGLPRMDHPSEAGVSAHLIDHRIIAEDMAALIAGLTLCLKSE